MRLVLVGLRGSGKTTCGRAAAASLGIAFLDLDTLVEARGRTISQIFTTEGEEGFRRLEREVLIALEPPADAILATGGGAVLLGENRARLAALGTVVQLDAAPEVLAARVMGSDRPRLSGEDSLTEAIRLHARRDPLYRSLSSHRLDTGALSEEEVVACLVTLFRRGRPKG